MKVSERLLARLVTEGIIPEGVPAQIRRSNASRSQRVAGAWSWFAFWPEAGRSEVSAGSQYPMADCLKAKAWDVARTEFGDWDLDPSAADRAAKVPTGQNIRGG
jgi:hypothetical protein